MTPNADRDNQNRIPINQETYLMTNMVPQAPDNNQGPWAAFEGYLRTVTDGGKEVYIISGPAGIGGSGSNAERLPPSLVATLRFRPAPGKLYWCCSRARTISRAWIVRPERSLS
jgi:hypothetical protein